MLHCFNHIIIYVLAIEKKGWTMWPVLKMKEMLKMKAGKENQELLFQNNDCPNGIINCL